MEETDRKILQNMLARKVGKAVNDVIVKLGDFDEDIQVRAIVDKPSCYVDDSGTTHFGRLITIEVDIIEEAVDDED